MVAAAHLMNRSLKSTKPIKTLKAKGHKMSPRRRGRGRGQIPEESEGQNEEIQRSFPGRRRTRQIKDEVDVLAARVDEMKLIMMRFQRMNPHTFGGSV
ncbi:hypothetical protein F511_40252 [Dorcoceras hygrometricum]|uniref:Uncharacterized protein n=1 Tax=Dorcoceras hygrometricum TaxID=472368 RepID=A0A2Z7ARF7_9LAMI|nr:hypothetical protein F511_40252 [Dorcoceras hygrometricum]